MKGKNVAKTNKRNVESRLYSLIQTGEKGTVQDFCDKLNYDNPQDIEFAIARLEADNKAELLKTEVVHESDGSPVYLGVYGSPKSLKK